MNFLDISSLFEQEIASRSIFPQRSAVIIDGGYWEALRKSIGNPEIDLVRLSETLCKPAYRFRTYFFDGTDTERHSFHQSLNMKERFEVVLGDVVSRDTRCPLCEGNYEIRAQKRVDVLLAVRLVHLASTKQVDLIVLLAGDRDFLPVVEVAKSAGVTIRLAFNANSIAPGLLSTVDERIRLTQDYLEDFLTDKKVKVEESEPTEKVVEVVPPKEEPSQETIEAAVNCLEELLTLKKASRVFASDLGEALRGKNIRYGGKLKDLMYLAKERVQIHQEGTLLSFSLSEKELPITDEQDPAIKFLLETIAEIQLKEKTPSVKVAFLGTKMHQKNPQWKKTFGISQKKGLSTLLQRAKKYLKIRGKGAKKKVSLISAS